MMREDFKNLFWKLSESHYESHWWTRHTKPPTDCSDRAYLLAKWCRENEVDYHFIYTLFMNPWPDLHISIVIDGMVYDPIWKLYETPILEYKYILNGLISKQVPKWIERIIP